MFLILLLSAGNSLAHTHTHEQEFAYVYHTLWSKLNVFYLSFAFLCFIFCLELSLRSCIHAIYLTQTPALFWYVMLACGFLFLLLWLVVCFVFFCRLLSPYNTACFTYVSASASVVVS